MKNLKKLSGILLAIAVLLACTVSAFAQDVTYSGSNPGGATITIKNAAKGETYKVYKLFDATVREGGTSIAYYTESAIPTGLTDYFAKDDNNFVSVKDAAWADPETKAEISENLANALGTWVESAEVVGTSLASAISDGSELNFKSLPYGYYVVTSTQTTKAITVTSTKPDAVIYDKNATTPVMISKSVDDYNVFIGQTVTYTLVFSTSNYDGKDSTAKQITKYTITDTLPAFLDEVKVTSIIIDEDGQFETTTNDQKVFTEAELLTHQFNTNPNGKFDIAWVDENSKSLYKNGSHVQIKYTAVVTDKAAIDGDGNTNSATLSFTTSAGETTKETKDATIYTYAFMIKKVNDKAENLAKAKFQLPFYVKETPDANGAYIYAGTTPGSGLKNELETPANGEIYIKGVETGTYKITETAAPDGYNRIVGQINVVASDLNGTNTDVTKYLDANGNVIATDDTSELVVRVNNSNLAANVNIIVNKTGLELPSTGGIGTTIFYIVGGVLVAAAVVLLVAKKRTSENR